MVKKLQRLMRFVVLHQLAPDCEDEVFTYPVKGSYDMHEFEMKSFQRERRRLQVRFRAAA